uniref:C2H2-type domain-containing protein n=1 Tax=Strigamia maritima TaxID=126957 RepID=T1J0K9_STRMM
MISDKSWKNVEMKVSKKLNSESTSKTHCCATCNKVFSSLGKLQQHNFVHTGEKPFKCGDCAKSFSSKFKLMRHMLIHSSDRKYSCSICERCFHRKDHLKNHLQVHNPNKKVHRCEHCSKEYNSRLSFRKHVAIHAAQAGDLNCKVCDKNFKTSDEILYHLKVHAGSRTIKNPNEKKFKCEFCERHFFTRKDVKRHLVVHTGRRDFLCQFCPQRFGRKDHLVRHIKKGHSLSPTRGPKTPKQSPDAQKVLHPPSPVSLVPLLAKTEPNPAEYSTQMDPGPSGLYPVLKHLHNVGIGIGIGIGIKTECLKEELQPLSNYAYESDSDRFFGYIPVESAASLPLTNMMESEQDVPPLPRFSQAF